MKSINLKYNFKRIFRSSITCLAALSMAMGPLAVLNAYADTQMGMTWTRIKDADELYKTFAGVPEPSSDGKEKVGEQKPNTNLNDVTGFKPILILYNSGGRWEYVQSGQVSGDVIKGTAVTATSGIKPGEDSFSSRTNCNSIYCKYVGDSSSAHEYAFSYRDVTGVGTNCIALNMKWYGIAWHCAARGDFRSAPRSNPSSAEDDSGAACSASIMTSWRIEKTGDGTFGIYWYTSSGTICNRHWSRDGSDIEITKSGGAYKDFQIYVGEECPVAVQTQSTYVQPFMYTKLVDYTIKSGVEIVVNEGACFVLDGENYNCGHIVVDGGTLVVRGLLDADTGGTGSSGKYGSYNTSDIHVINGGKLIVERGGVICNRNASSGIYVSDNSSVFVEGTMVVAKQLDITKNSSLRALPGSFIALGCQPLSDQGAAAYTPDNIASNSGAYLSGLASISLVNQGTLNIGNNSSFVSYGAVFIPSTTNITYGTNSFADAWFSTNGNASLSSMMKQW